MLITQQVALVPQAPEAGALWEAVSRHCSTGGTIFTKGKTTMGRKVSTTLSQDLKHQDHHAGQNPIKPTGQAPPPLIPPTAARLHCWKFSSALAACSRGAAFWGLKGFWNIFDIEASHYDVKNNTIKCKASFRLHHFFSPFNTPNSLSISPTNNLGF